METRRRFIRYFFFQVANLEERLDNQVSDAVEQDQTALLEEKQVLSGKCVEYETEIEELKEELLIAQTERDDIFAQAEGKFDFYMSGFGTSSINAHFCIYLNTLFTT